MSEDRFWCDDPRWPGIHCPTTPENCEAPEGWSYVERCDTWTMYETDLEAACALVLMGHASSVAVFDRETGAVCAPEHENAAVAVNAVFEEVQGCCSPR